MLAPPAAAAAATSDRSVRCQFSDTKRRGEPVAECHRRRILLCRQSWESGKLWTGQEAFHWDRLGTAPINDPVDIEVLVEEDVVMMQIHMT